MSNSPLVDYVKISPNSSNPRNQPISVITIHHMAGNLSVEACGNVFATTDRQASSNYGIGSDGRVGMYVEEANRSWCSSSRENDNKAITIEVANDDTTSGNWHVSDTALAKLIDLCVDICQRNSIPKLNFTGDKSGNLTMHKWFAATACPGPYLESKFPYIAEQVNLRLGGASSSDSKDEVAAGTQGSAFANLTADDAVAKIGELCKADMKKSGILASVSAAQFILESGYGKAELSQKANNCFGMKASLSGNSWSGSVWDASSAYSLNTQEQNEDGSYTAITADFRKYSCVEDSIADHSAYLLGAMNGSKKRYEGLAGCTDYKKAVQIIKDGGYATDLSYVDKLCSLIERLNLIQYDAVVAEAPQAKPIWYRVRKSWADTKSQVGAFKILANAKACADKNLGYSVFDPDGNAIYPEQVEQPFSPYLVQVKIADLNIRTGPGTNYNRTGAFTGIGVFTIVSEADGQGASKWGKLKSGAGWISMDYTKKL